MFEQKKGVCGCDHHKKIMSGHDLRLRKTLNVNPSFHYQRMIHLQGVLDHFIALFKLQRRPFVIGPPPSSNEAEQEKVNVNKNVTVAILDASLLSRVGFFIVYWFKIYVCLILLV